MSYAFFGFGQEGEAESGVSAQDCMDRGGTPLADNWCAFCPPNETFYISLDACDCVPGMTRDPSSGVCGVPLVPEEEPMVEPSAEVVTPIVTPGEEAAGFGPALVPSPAPVLVSPGPLPSPAPGPAPVTTAAMVAEKPTPWLLYGAIGVSILAIAALSTGRSASSNPRRRRISRRCPIGTKIQTLIFEKDGFSGAQSKSWAKKHGYRYGKIDETSHSYRIRQESPRYFVSGSLRTIRLTDDVKAVIGCPRR